MGMCFLLTKVAFVAFFELNGWNMLQDAGKQTAKFKTNYKTFEKTVKARAGVDLPSVLSSASVQENIVKGLGWAQIALAVGTALISGMLAAPLGIVYFLQQLVHLNVAGLSMKTPLAEIEQLALAVALLTACFMMASHSCCSKSCAVSKRDGRESQMSDVESRAKDKKRN